MDWRYEYWSASAVSSVPTNSVVPSLTVRTGTGVASATPAAVTIAAPSATKALLRPGEAGRSRTVTRCAAADDHLFLPDTLRLRSEQCRPYGRAAQQAKRLADLGTYFFHTPFDL